MEYHRVDNYGETLTQNIIKVGEVNIGQKTGNYEEEAGKTTGTLDWLKYVYLQVSSNISNTSTINDLFHPREGRAA